MAPKHTGTELIFTTVLSPTPFLYLAHLLLTLIHSSNLVQGLPPPAGLLY